MNLLAPFFPPRTLPSSNFGAALKDAAKRMSDTQIVEWAAGIDWQEPVVSLQRVQGNRTYGEEAYTTIYSPLEILVLSADVRLIKLLLTPEIVPKHPIMLQEASLRRDAYQVTVGLINAAIRTGSVDILEHVCDVALKGNPHSPFQWNSSSGTYTPIVCLADQRHFPANLAWNMWRCLEALALDNAIGGGVVGKEYRNNIRDSLRNSLLSDAARLGNCHLATKIAGELRTQISLSQWKDLVYGGNFDWACNFLTTNRKWGKEKRDDRNTNKEQPLAFLCSRMLQQRSDINDTFKRDEKRMKFLSDNDASFAALMDALKFSFGGSSLLSSYTKEASSQAGSVLVKWSSKYAARTLSAIQAEMSVEEAVAWMEKVVASPKSAAHLSLRLNGCPPREDVADEWVDILQDNIKVWAEKNDGGAVPALFDLCKSLGIKDLHSTLRASRSPCSEDILMLASQLQASILDSQSAPVHHKKASRRL
jgi:hypothetical protein